MLKKTNINYVFNAISLANVFATDLSMMQFNKQKWHICVSFLLLLNNVALSSPASYSSCDLFELLPVLYRH